MNLLILAIWAIIFIVAMAFAGRAHGAATEDEVTKEPTGWPTWGRTAATILFGVSFAATNFVMSGIWWLALLGGALSAFGLATGHGRFYAMNGANIADPKPEWIERYIARWIYDGDITEPRYSFVCMGIKGLMIGLAAYPFGIALAVLWPLAYYVSFKLWQDSAPAEWVSSACAGLVIIATLAI